MEGKKIHLTYGAIAGLVMMLFSLGLYLADLTMKQGVSYVVYLPFLVGTIMNGIAFSKANDGFVTFGNVFQSCFKSSMIVTLMMVVYAVIIVYAFPEMKEKALEAARTQMLKNPQTTDEQIETALKITRKYWTVILVGGNLLGTLFWGAIFSLLGALVARKKGERPFTADNF